MLKKICTIFLFSLITFTGLFGTLTPQAAAQSTQTTPPTTQTPPSTTPSGSTVSGSTSQCGVISTGGAIVYNPLQWMACAITATVEIILGFFGKMVFYTGVFFNYSVEITIVRMADVIGHMPAIEVGWKALRDLGNIAFIFILVYIAVITIIGGKDSGQWKQLVLNVVIIALLVNFSLFLTKVTIDASNLLSLQFYNAIASPGTLADKNAGLSWVFFNATRLSTLYAPNAITGGNLNNFTAVTQNQLNPEIRLPTNQSTFGNVILVGLMGSIFFLITSFVFLATGILLVSRFVSLVFLLITSGIAAVMYILPATRGLFDSWLKRLINQLIFAPVLMIMLWLVAFIINGTCTAYAANGTCTAGNQSFIAAALSSGSQPLTVQATATIADTLVSGVPGTVFLILNFVILMAFMIAALVVSREAGHMSSGFAAKWAGKLTFGTAGFVGRQTIGRGFYKLSQTNALKNFATSSPIVGGSLLTATRRVANSNFDIRSAPVGIGSTLVKQLGTEKAPDASFEKTAKARAASQEAFAKSLGKDIIYKDSSTGELASGLEKEEKTIDEKIGEHDKQLTTLQSEKAKKIIESEEVANSKSAVDTSATALEQARQELEKSKKEGAGAERIVELQNIVGTKETIHKEAQKSYKEATDAAASDVNEKIKQVESLKYERMKERKQIQDRLKALRANGGISRDQAYLGKAGIINHVLDAQSIIDKHLKEAKAKESRKLDLALEKRVKKTEKENKKTEMETKVKELEAKPTRTTEEENELRVMRRKIVDIERDLNKEKDKESIIPTDEGGDKKSEEKTEKKDDHAEEKEDKGGGH